MKKTALLILVFSFTAALLYAQSEEETESETSLGASPNKKPIAGFTVLTAEDAQVSTDGKTTYVENVYAYTGRKFKAVEARLKKIETAQEDLNSRVKYIEQYLTDTKNAALVSKEAAEAAPKEPPQKEQTL